MQDHDSLEDFLTRLMTHPAEYDRLQRLLTLQLKSAPKSQLQVLLRRLLSYIVSVESLKRFKYRYTPEIEVFADCIADHPHLHSSYLQTVCQYPAKAHHHCAELESMRADLSVFLNDLRQRSSSRAFRVQVNQQQSQMNRTCRAMCQYVDALFATHARLVVIRVDFSYQRQADIELEQFESDLKRLNESTSHNPLFKHMVGYLFKIEYGMEKGLHAHCLLFFNGAKRKGSSDWHLAKQIGEHWRDTIVGAQGHYWNCHDEKARYAELGLLGIGDIHYSDTVSIENLKTIVKYFCKRQQYIKPITKPKMQLVRPGNSPDTDSVKLGKPRKADGVI